MQKEDNLSNYDIRDIAVELLSPQGNIGNFNAQESAIAIDTIEIAYRRFKVS